MSGCGSSESMAKGPSAASKGLPAAKGSACSVSHRTLRALRPSWLERKVRECRRHCAGRERHSTPRRASAPIKTNTETPRLGKAGPRPPGRPVAARLRHSDLPAQIRRQLVAGRALRDKVCSFPSRITKTCAQRDNYAPSKERTAKIPPRSSQLRHIFCGISFANSTFYRN